MVDIVRGVDYLKAKIKQDPRIAPLIREIRVHSDAGDALSAGVAHGKLDALIMAWHEGRPLYSRVDVTIVSRGL